MTDIELLIESLLKKGDKKSTKLAKIIYKNDLKEQSSEKEKRLAKEYLYSLFDDDMRRKMIVLDSIISENDRKIPWKLSYFRDRYFHKRDTIGYETFVVERCGDGFFPYDNSPMNEHYKYLFDVEKSFVEKHKKELSEVHFALTEQEELLREYVSKSDNRELIKLLVYHLGLLKSWEEEKRLIK